MEEKLHIIDNNKSKLETTCSTLLQTKNTLLKIRISKLIKTGYINFIDACFQVIDKAIFWCNNVENKVMEQLDDSGKEDVDPLSSQSLNDNQIHQNNNNFNSNSVNNQILGNNNNNFNEIVIENNNPNNNNNFNPNMNNNNNFFNDPLLMGGNDVFIQPNDPPPYHNDYSVVRNGNNNQVRIEENPIIIENSKKEEKKPEMKVQSVSKIHGTANKVKYFEERADEIVMMSVGEENQKDYDRMRKELLKELNNEVDTAIDTKYQKHLMNIIHFLNTYSRSTVASDYVLNNLEKRMYTFLADVNNIDVKDISSTTDFNNKLKKLNQDIVNFKNQLLKENKDMHLVPRIEDLQENMSSFSHEFSSKHIIKEGLDDKVLDFRRRQILNEARKIHQQIEDELFPL